MSEERVDTEPGGLRADRLLRWISDGCVLFDAELRLVYANPRGNALLDGVRPPFRAAAEQAMSTQVPRVVVLRDLDRQHWIEARLHPSPDGLLVLLADVTEVQRAGVEQATRLDHLSRLVEQLPAFLWIIDRDMRVLRFEGGNEILSELGRDAIVGRHMTDVSAWGVMSPEDLALALRMHGRALRGEGGHYRSTWRGMVLEARVQPMRGPRGEIVGAIGVAMDVTQQERAQARLRESEERFRALVEHNDAHIGILDARARLVYASPSYTRDLGYTMEELRAMPSVWSLVHPDDVAYAKKELRAAAHRAGFTMSRPVRCVAKPGHTHSYAVTVTDLRDNPAVRGVVVNARDVTEELALEAQLRQAQKMEALGMLAGSVAHDFNNLLTAILGGAELARQAVPSGTPVAEDLDDIRQAALRAAALTRQLLTFSRTQVRRPHPLDLRDAVRRAEGLLRRLLPDDVALDVVLAHEPCVVRADATQIEQVMMNLVVNAADATVAAHRGGVVTLEVARRPPDAALVVRDAGVGMSAEALGHAFDPFFTTKAEGRGTGLGLTTVQSIVAQSEGTVRVESTAGVGSTFTVLLPLVTDAPDVERAEPPRPPRGTETILVVEDEAIVRDMAMRILERQGYRVVTARHGADALLAWREHGGAIDGVVTDLRMPAMGGRALAEVLRAERPTLPLVLMSGYPSATDATDAALVQREVFLEKPFTAETLLLCVREALDRGG